MHKYQLPFPFHSFPCHLNEILIYEKKITRQLQVCKSCGLLETDREDFFYNYEGANCVLENDAPI